MTFDGECFIARHQNSPSLSSNVAKRNGCRFAADLEGISGELQTPEKKSWSLLLEAVTALSQQAAIFKRESFFLGTIES
jgi:hypothetical protein